MRRLPGILLSVLLLAGAAQAPSLQEMLQQLKQTADPAQAARLREQIQQRWIAAGPVSAQVLLKEAAQAQAAGLRETALRLLRLVARRWPDYAEGRYRLAFFLWQTRRTAAALQELNALLEDHPDHFPALALRVRLLLEEEQLQEALGACQALVERFPNWREMRQRCNRLRWRLEQDA